jgi:predicted histidine transporter YuiF (NhaC family)
MWPNSMDTTVWGFILIVMMMMMAIISRKIRCIRVHIIFCPVMSPYFEGGGNCDVLVSH